MSGRPAADFQLVDNPQACRGAAYAADERQGFDPFAAERARRALRSWRDYAPTPLVSLPELAASLGVREVVAKDEGARTDLASFKALGGAYALSERLKLRVAQETGDSNVTIEDLERGTYEEVTRRVVATCASDGNHGRSVAWGARRFRCGCVVYLPKSVSRRRAEAIEAYGAQVIWVDGNYDDAVRQAAVDAAEHGREVISDTSSPDYQDIPRQVMAGYSLLFEEVVDQMAEPPTHVFVQVGCGALAAVAAGYFWSRLGAERPVVVAVEPLNAACLLETVQAGDLAVVGGDHATIMGGLACGEVSFVAWKVLRGGLDHAISMADDYALRAMRLLGRGLLGERIIAGETGAAGVGALLALLDQPEALARLRMGPESRVLVVVTEGATDPELYERLISRASAS